MSKFRPQRLQAISERISQDGSNYDIIALQEIWVEEDYELLISKTESQFPYHKYFYSGILSGPGLLVISKWPIQSASLYRYPLNGRPSAFFRGDWYVGKSAASVVIQPPLPIAARDKNPGIRARPIELISTHLHAPYGPGDAAYTCHRTAQAWDLTHIARRAGDLGHAVVVVGDLNSVPGSLTHRLFQHTALLRDSWQDIHGEFEGGQEAMGLLSPEDQIALAGTTCDSQLNTWRADRARDEAKRLDYIFYDPKHLTPAACRVSFTEPVPSIGTVSDHFAVEAELLVHPIGNVLSEPHPNLSVQQPPPTYPKPDLMDAHSHSNSVNSEITSQITPGSYASGPFGNSQAIDSSIKIPPQVPLTVKAKFAPSSDDELRLLYTDILDLIESYKPTSIMQAKLRNYHFIASVIILVAMLIAVWWGAAHNRAYVGFIFLLVAIVVSITGLLDGLIGFLFGRNEWRALREFESEVRLELRFLDA